MTTARPSSSRRWLDLLWLLALGVYIVAGIPLATFHGDEAMQIHMSRDYVTTFIERAPERLLTAPPYPIDSDAHLRILNGSVNRYTIGLSLHLAGYTLDDLPPPPGWDWGLSYSEGVATGHRPADDLLFAARLPSALFLWGSVVVLFALSRFYGPRWLAYVTTAIYALHPVILLNGRRAMQEGSLLFFGLLAVLIAAYIARQRTNGEPVRWVWWFGLAVAGALTLASKHSGIVFIAGAYGWILAAELVGRRPILRVIGGLAVSGIVTVALFVALSPALWNDPNARFGNLLAVRQELLDIQVAIDPIAPTTLPYRVIDLVVQPFFARVVHYELESWGQDSIFLAEIARANASLFSDPFRVIGIPLTLLAGIGLIVTLRHIRQPRYLGLLAVFAVITASLLVNPLPWQRYYLPLIPMVVLLVGSGFLQIMPTPRTKV